MARTCPDCHNTYEDEVLHCPEDGLNLANIEKLDELIGRTVGSYKVMKPLGKGGMGAVYLGEHPVIGSKVAIKFLHPQYATDEKIVDRFFNEARAVNVIGHDNILKILDLNVTEDRRHYFIMEFLNGRALQSLLRHNVAMPLSEAGPILLQICEALQAAHDHGIIHRDLKPDNVYLITHKGRKNFVKVVDFGIAKLTDDQGVSTGKTQTGMVMGTPAYMSPEQGGGKTSEIDARSDIYSLGVMMFQMATGRLPFPGSSFGEVLVGHLQQAPPVPRELVPEIPEQYEAVILKCLEKQQGDRFQSMRELHDTILDTMQALGITTELPFEDKTDELTPVDPSARGTPSNPGPRTPGRPTGPGRGPSLPGRNSNPGKQVSSPGKQSSNPPRQLSNPPRQLSTPGRPPSLSGRSSPGAQQTVPAQEKSNKTPILIAAVLGALFVLGTVGYVVKMSNDNARELSARADKALAETNKAAATRREEAAQAAADQLIFLSVVSEPLEAQVEATWKNGGHLSGTTPLDIQVPQGSKVHFDFRKSGFIAYSTEVIADRAQSVTARLKVDSATAPVAQASSDQPRRKREKKEAKKDAAPASNDGLIDLSDALK